MKKLVYILPEYRDEIGTHFYHNVELLERVKKDIDVVLLIERGKCPKHFKACSVLWFRWLPLRACELFVRFFVLKMHGYDTFWTHYSFISGIIAPMFGTSYYWNCGMPWLYKRGIIEEYFFRKSMTRSILVTGTEGMKKKYSNEYGLLEERILVLPNFINISRFLWWRGKKTEARKRLQIPDGKKIVFFLHHLSKRKGADLIMPVAHEFRNNRDVLFLVGGAGPLLQEIHGDNIKIIGEIPHREVPMYFAASDVFFMPSEEEGFPHVVLESLAMGVPIVASNIGGVSEIIPQEHTNYLVSHGDIVGYVSQLRTILEKDRTQDTTIALQTAKKYDIETILNRFLDIIDERKHE